MKTSRQHGFTIIELMVTVGIAGILLAVAVPNMRVFIQNNRLTTVANDLLHSMQMARSEAIKRQSQPDANGRVAPKWVDVCAVANSEAAVASLSCNNGAFSNWIVFVDNNRNGQFDNTGDVLLERGKANSSVSAKKKSSGDSGIVCFKPDGFANVDCNGLTPTQRVVYCDSRPLRAIGTDTTARAVLITTTGRSSVTRNYTLVTSTLTSMGASCP